MVHTHTHTHVQVHNSTFSDEIDSSDDQDTANESFVDELEITEGR